MQQQNGNEYLVLNIWNLDWDCYKYILVAKKLWVTSPWQSWSWYCLWAGQRQQFLKFVL